MEFSLESSRTAYVPGQTERLMNLRSRYCQEKPVEKREAALPSFLCLAGHRGPAFLNQSDRFIKVLVAHGRQARVITGCLQLC
ncbi:hypothetical protein BRADI_5g14633v3 [Brachypodium distachyon]|uniref:Uncharacterized protein n=1 Tax=Brachypodium distachyon TaxID=15368 RepID=A0A2K2CH72_BRADI|nr:hypothetical protein BRADI_5g14633v3 [Brachypodium distachyon]